MKLWDYVPCSCEFIIIVIVTGTNVWMNSKNLMPQSCPGGSVGRADAPCTEVVSFAAVGSNPPCGHLLHVIPSLSPSFPSNPSAVLSIQPQCPSTSLRELSFYYISVYRLFYCALKYFICRKHSSDRQYGGKCTWFYRFIFPSLFVVDLQSAVRIGWKMELRFPHMGLGAPFRDTNKLSKFCDWNGQLEYWLADPAVFTPTLLEYQ